MNAEDSAELKRYRFMATIVGCMVIVVFTFFFWGLATDPTSWPNRYETFVMVVDQVHGLLYMIFLVVAAMLSRAQRWGPGFTITTLLAGTVPILSFWAEHRATKVARAGQQIPARTMAEASDRKESRGTDRDPHHQPR